MRRSSQPPSKSFALTPGEVVSNAGAEMRLYRKVLISEATGTAFVRQSHRAVRSALAMLGRPFRLIAADAFLERGPRFCGIKNYFQEEATMKETNANIDLCGIRNLLHLLLDQGFTEAELNKITARIAQETGADIIFC